VSDQPSDLAVRQSVADPSSSHGIWTKPQDRYLLCCQTDSQLVIGPDKTLLIDCGAAVAGSKKQYEYIAGQVEALTGKRKFDYFLISHYHYDHMGSRYPNSDEGNGLWGLLG